jgi:hypothetical protein
MKEFTDMLKKKAAEQSKDPVDPKTMEAKASAIKHLMGSLKEMMGGELKDGLKKVTVASDSPEGLEEGLELAKKVAHNAPKPEGVEELSHEMDDEEMEDESESELQQSDEDRKVAELEKQLAELKAKKAPKPS